MGHQQTIFMLSCGENMIRACMNTYNDMSTIQLALESLQGHVDEIIAVDGPYSTFPGAYADPWSSDGTLEILEQYGVKIIGQGIYSNQMVKRQTYFDYCRPSDWAFVFDADEVLIHGKNLQNLDPDISPYWGCNIIQLYLHQDDYQVRDRFRPRVFYMRDKLRYFNRHWTILNKENNDIMAYPNYMSYPWIASLIHMNIFRSQKRLNDKKWWYTGGAVRRLERNAGYFGKPLNARELDLTACLFICKKNEHDKICVNYDNGFCHAYKNAIPEVEYQTTKEKSTYPYAPDVIWREKNG